KRTNPLEIDSDRDGLSDGKEIEVGTNPLNVDTDGDTWDDLSDISPTNAAIPNGFIVGIVFGAIFITVILLKKRRRAPKRRRH
ncbi:MAG: hypothetical protein GTN76_15950, partial [Candidatus Aenigmarchaeota archaeon]|nr:hypothetical protein [Candidatus Aenigmarchaeota archaeon]